MLKQGDKAPPFTLHSTPDQVVSLSDCIDKNVVLIFYPADRSPVCGDEIALFNEALPIFRKYNVQLLGISVDSVWSHNAFAKANKIHFPLLADFEPKGEVCKAYGVYREKEGSAERALFVIDRKGIIQYSYLSPTGMNLSADGVLNRLEEMEKKSETVSH